MYDVAVYNPTQHEQFRTGDGHFALRQSATDDKRWVLIPAEQLDQRGGGVEFLVADGAVAIRASEDVPAISRPDGRPLTQDRRLPLPCLICVAATWIEIARPGAPRELAPLLDVEAIDFLAPDPVADSPAGPSSATIARWLSEAGRLHRAAAGSPEFYADAARFVVEAVGLDAAWVLDRQADATGDQWQIVGSHLPHPNRGVKFDRDGLDHLKLEAVAWYEPVEVASATPNHVRSSQSIVVAPVHDLHGQLTAAIYGVRDTRGGNRRRGVRPLEARLVQLLAESVAVGIARLEQETAAARTRVLLEQAFSPTVAQHIERNPDSLSGQLRDVTLLFADLRNFTTLAETISPGDCYQLLGDVMEVLTQIVMQLGGVVVDYFGDGLLALWNAPLDQPAHADLACSAACQMFSALPAATERWQKHFGMPLELGIGIHSGPALVGNAGTESRLKYGPRGNTVNIASRVQAASKQLQLPLVLTAATQTKLSSDFFTLRVCTAKLPGLEQPTELYTAYPASEAWRIKSRLDQYARALALFEQGELEAAERLLTELVSYGQATPAEFLAHYAAAQRKSHLGRRAVDKYASLPGPVIEIHGK